MAQLHSLRPSTFALRALTSCCLAAALALPALAQTGPGTPPAKVPLKASHYALQARAIGADTWVIEGAVDDFSRANGCNIINTGFIATPAGTWVINTGPSRLYGEQQRQVVDAVRQRTGAGPVLQVLNLNLHPDYFLGNQAWDARTTRALAGTIAGQAAEGRAYEDNLFRLCGDWMLGTEHRPATQALEPGTVDLGRHRLELLRLSGHTPDDLVLIDHHTGVVFAGGLVFADRVPTTPHAQIPQWIASLQQLQTRIQALHHPTIVPSHGPVTKGLNGIAQTLDWLHWLDQTLRASAESGLDLGEVIRLPIPPRFALWAALPAEFIRSVHHLYPRYEQQALRRVTGAPATKR